MERNAACQNIEGANERVWAEQNGKKLRGKKKKEKKGEWREHSYFCPPPTSLPFSARSFVPLACFCK